MSVRRVHTLEHTQRKTNNHMAEGPHETIRHQIVYLDARQLCEFVNMNSANRVITSNSWVECFRFNWNNMSEIAFLSTRWPILASFAVIVVLCAAVYRIMFFLVALALPTRGNKSVYEKWRVLPYACAGL